MKLMRQAVILCALFGGLWGISTALAEDPVKSAEGQAPAAAPKAAEAAKDLVLKGDAKCTRCHDETDSPKALSIGKTRHGTIADSRSPTCTSCHGDSDAHLANLASEKDRPKPDRMFTKDSTTPIASRNEACLTCHKGGNRIHWEGSQHSSNDIACTSCHQVHTQHDKVREKATQSEVCFTCHKTQRAQTHRMSTHPLAAGKMACSDCHNPHGSTGPKLLVKNSVNETCYTCHAEKRGPFLWEHPSANDDCMNCHTPHGSTNSPLLKGRSPWLCQQCHGSSAPHPGNVYSAANLPGGAVANVNQTGGTTSSSGTAPTGASMRVTGVLNGINPLTGEKTTANNPSIQTSFRGCANCHSQVHGSNHPGGYRLLR